MATTSAESVVKSLPDADLRQAVREVLAWHRSGVLSDGVLRQIAVLLTAKTGLDAEADPRLAETQVLLEVAARFAAQV